jgi:ribosomal protein L32
MKALRRLLARLRCELTAAGSAGRAAQRLSSDFLADLDAIDAALNQVCRACGHREHDHHHTAEPRWCGAGYPVFGEAGCPCPGFAGRQS